MRSRKRLLTLTSFLVAALAAQAAEAAPPAPPPGQTAKQSSSQFTLRREEAGGPDANTARTRARAGDCAGALPAFDAAIRVTIEPTLRRDRGLCHEKLNDPFPAIEDYRAYLTARPDAPDADQIRDRLARLEEQVGVGGPSAQAVKGRDSEASASGSFSLGTEGGSASSSSSSSRSRKSASLGPRSGEQGKSYDYYAAQEKLADVAETSPLRFGTGWVIGPFLTLPRYFVGDVATSDLAYTVGAAIRYSFSPSVTFITEVGYGGIGESGKNTAFSGPLVMAGIELRIPLDTWASNQLLLGGGLGYEHYTVSGSKIGVNFFDLRGRFGYRHVFGPTVGLEILVDGGPVYGKATDTVAGQGSTDGKTGGIIGVSYALVIGF